MSDFKTRLIDEKAELGEKIDKLSDFLKSENSKSIDEFQLILLNIQLRSMITYFSCLEARINRL